MAVLKFAPKWRIHKLYFTDLMVPTFRLPNQNNQSWISIFVLRQQNLTPILFNDNRFSSINRICILQYRLITENYWKIVTCVFNINKFCNFKINY